MGDNILLWRANLSTTEFVFMGFLINWGERNPSVKFRQETHKKIETTYGRQRNRIFLDNEIFLKGF